MIKKSNTLSVLERVKALHAKDTSIQKILSNASGQAKVYSESDGVPLPEQNPIRQMTGLPCLPFNRVIQVAGKPDAGKSTTAGEVMASAQRNGFEVVLIDTEDKFDSRRYEVEFGGTTSSLHIIKSNEIRKLGQLAKDYVTVLKQDNSNVKILIVWDSVGGSISRSSSDRNLADDKHAQPGQDAKENGEVIRHWVGMFNKYEDTMCVLLINQTYAKIGFMQKGDKAKGGDAIWFFSSLIIHLKCIKTLVKIVNKIKMKFGIVTRATVTKNHLSQGKTSVYQMDFTITSEGYKVSSEEIPDDETSDDES